MSTGEICAADVGTAWRLAASSLLSDGGSSFHLAVRIGNVPDAPIVRSAVDKLQADCGVASIATVSNTIFPQGIAASSASHEDLTDRYLRLYPRLRSAPGNHHGTYFGRMVDHPGGGVHANQLSHVINKLAETQTGQKRKSRYEMPIYHPASDSARLMGFPCLSHCAFHLDPDNDQVHLVALYRNQWHVQRAYGNYLGLANLRNYVAAQAGRSPGELLVVAGHAEIDQSHTKVRQTLAKLDKAVGAPQP